VFTHDEIILRASCTYALKFRDFGAAI